MNQNERDNLVRYNPKSSSGQLESFFLKANHPTEPKAFWLKFTVYQPEGRPEKAVGDVWAIAFDGDGHNHVAVKESYPLASCKLGYDAVGVTYGPSSFTTGKTSGRAVTGEQSIAWDLEFDPVGEPFHHFPNEKLYKTKLPSSKALSPYPDTRFRGTMTVNGKPWKIDGWKGMEGHNWGSKHTDLYAWGHCNLWDSGEEDTFFEGFTGKLKLGPLWTPPVTRLFLRYRGKNYEMRTLKGTVSPGCRIETSRWTFDVEAGEHRLKGFMTCSKEDMAGLYYKNPAGPMTHCLNSKIARCELTLTERGKTVCTLVSSHGSALEVATHDPDHGVKMRV